RLPSAICLRRTESTVFLKGTPDLPMLESEADTLVLVREAKSAKTLLAGPCHSGVQETRFCQNATRRLTQERSMGSLLRDLLRTLSYTPDASSDSEALSRLDQRLNGFAHEDDLARGAISVRPADCTVWHGNRYEAAELSADRCRELIDSI